LLLDYSLCLCVFANIVKCLSFIILVSWASLFLFLMFQAQRLSVEYSKFCAQSLDAVQFLHWFTTSTSLVSQLLVTNWLTQVAKRTPRWVVITHIHLAVYPYSLHPLHIYTKYYQSISGVEMTVANIRSCCKRDIYFTYIFYWLLHHL
jgi:hypothetical protein